MLGGEHVCGCSGCWGMGCLYNEVRRGLLLTMKAKGVRLGFITVSGARLRLGWCCSGLCVRELGGDTVGGEGGEGARTEELEEEKWTTRHLQSQRHTEVEQGNIYWGVCGATKWWLHFHLSGFVVDAGNGRALRFFRPLSLQIRPHDGVQRQGASDGGFRRASRGPFSFLKNRNKTSQSVYGFCFGETFSCEIMFSL